jgi:hypothetical protein
VWLIGNATLRRFLSGQLGGKSDLPLDDSA